MRQEFKSAARDYRFLLEKNYPQKGIIKLTGDRYALSSTERTMLYRGITSRSNCVSRKAKRSHAYAIGKNRLHIDGYNVMLTIGSYLNGNTVFISNDGLLRDAAELHGKVFRKELMDRILDILLNELDHLRPAQSMFYFDRPVSRSGELAQKLNSRLKDACIQGRASVHDSADHPLKQARKGIIATSDSGIIDHAALPHFDLAHHVIRRNFSPVLIDLRTA